MMLRRRRLLLAVMVIILIPVAVIGWWLGSPLFISKTVDEEFPFAFDAVIPEDMEMAEVEEIMEGMAKINQEFNEPMPDTLAKAKGGDGSTNDQLPADPTSTPSPAFTPTPEPSQAELITEPVKLKSGNFQDADRSHKGSGRATVYRGADGSHLLRLEDFKTTNGPDLHVILTPHRAPKSRGDIKLPGYVDLGKLKGNIGNQNYPIPDNVDVTIQGSVVIYCKPFHVIFSVAPLQDLG